MLFTRRLSKDFEYKRNQGSEYDFLNSSPRPSVERIRVLIEEWYSHYPTEEKERLKTSFISRDNITHEAAFFELFCHELLLRHGFTVELHARDSNQRAKDFKAIKESDTLELEACVCTDEDEFSSEKKTLGTITDFLDEHAFVPGFRYAIDLKKKGKKLPGLRNLADEIVKWAKSFDRKALRTDLEDNRIDLMPSRLFVQDEWEIEIMLLPRPDDETDFVGFKQSIGIGPFHTALLHHDKALRNSLTRKSHHYAEYSYPYIIAICTSFSFPTHDEIDIFQALLGTEKIIFNVRISETRLSRKPDGLWNGPLGPRHKKVSAVLIANNLKCWNICTANLKLYINPYAENPIKYDLLRLDKCYWQQESGEIIQEKGEPLNVLFGLEPEWPGNE